MEFPRPSLALDSINLVYLTEKSRDLRAIGNPVLTLSRDCYQASSFYPLLVLDCVLTLVILTFPSDVKRLFNKR